MITEKDSRYRIALVFIISVAIFFRLYFIHTWLIFGMDQEYQALISSSIVHGKHIPLIGVNASDTGVYLGPWFSYLSAGIFFLFSGNPLGGAIFSSCLGVCVTAILYFLGKDMIGRPGALIASALYAGSFLVSFYDREFWNPSLVPLLSLLIGYASYQLSHRKQHALIEMSICLSLSFSVHLSLLIFFPWVTYVVWREKDHISKTIWVYALIFAGILIAPLVIFDLRHDLLNVKAAISSIIGNHHTEMPTLFMDRINIFFLFLEKVLWIPYPVDWHTISGQCKEFMRSYTTIPFFGLVLYSVLLWRLSRIKHTPLVVWYTIFASLFVMLIYPRQMFEYYYLYLVPWYFLMIGIVLSDLYRKIPIIGVWIVGILFIYSVVNAKTLLDSSYTYAYRDKIDAVQFASTYVRGRSYRLEAVGGCGRYGGWRYLFSYLVGPPTRSYMDAYFGWLYPEELSSMLPSRSVLLSFVDSRLPEKEKKEAKKDEHKFLEENNVVSKKRFGDITVIILDNKHE